MATLNQQMYELIEKMYDTSRRQRVGYRQRPQREAVLKYLGDYPEGVNPSQIAEHVGLARPAVTAMLTIMEEEGYITRTMSQSDKRRTDIKITEKGIKQKEALVKASQDCAAALVQHLGEKDSKELLRLLEKVEGFMQKA